MRNSCFCSFALILVTGLILVAGCNKDSASDSRSSSQSSGGSASKAGDEAISGMGDAEAVAVVRSEMMKRWVQTSDGWISEFPSQVSLMTGQRAGPESYYRELKSLDFEVQPQDVSDADKLNGLTYRGYVELKSSPMRFFNDPNSFSPRQWSAWKQSEPAVSSFGVRKVKGQWAVYGDGYPIIGAKPASGTLGQLK
jgi:hypothetical protein